MFAIILSPRPAGSVYLLREHSRLNLVEDMSSHSANSSDMALGKKIDVNIKDFGHSFLKSYLGREIINKRESLIMYGGVVISECESRRKDR